MALADTLTDVGFHEWFHDRRHRLNIAIFCNTLNTREIRNIFQGYPSPQRVRMPLQEEPWPSQEPATVLIRHISPELEG
jgi:hypothetical protein